jgi:hypothetical protein
MDSTIMRIFLDLVRKIEQQSGGIPWMLMGKGVEISLLRQAIIGMAGSRLITSTRSIGKCNRLLQDRRPRPVIAENLVRIPTPSAGETDRGQLELRSKGATVFWIANRGVQRGIRSWEEIQKSRLGPRRVCIGGSQDEGKLFSSGTEDH